MEDNLKTPLLDEYYGLKDKDSEKDKIVIENMTRMKLFINN